MSRRSQPDKVVPAQRGGASAPSLEARVAQIECFLREDASAHRLIDAGLAPGGMKLPGPANMLAERASIRSRLDSSLADTNRLSGHLDAIVNYLHGGSPAVSASTGETPTPYAVEDKLALLDSHLKYLLSKTEEILNRL